MGGWGGLWAVQPLFFTNRSRIGVARLIGQVVSVEADHLPQRDGIVAAVAPAQLRSFVDRGARNTFARAQASS